MMKKVIYLLLFFAFPLVCFAQEENAKTNQQQQEQTEKFTKWYNGVSYYVNEVGYFKNTYSQNKIEIIEKEIQRLAKITPPEEFKICHKKKIESLQYRVESYKASMQNNKERAEELILKSLLADMETSKELVSIFDEHNAPPHVKFPFERSIDMTKQALDWINRETGVMGISEAQKIPDGMHREYYENGKIMSEGAYKDNKSDGLWKVYYENGQLKSEVTYEDGIQIKKKDQN